MTLFSGDRIFFDICLGGPMTLQVVSAVNLSEDAKSDTSSRKDADTVILYGHDVSLLLYRLTTANADGCVQAGVPGSSKLLVNTLHDELGRVTVVLETDDNVIHLKAYERDMLVDAINSQVWRLFR